MERRFHALNPHRGGGEMEGSTVTEGEVEVVRCGSGRGGSARRDGSWPDGRWWHGIGLAEGDEGGAG
jgi:hypothetical protein